MGHKALIDGVGYDITGGRCLVDGVGYSIQKGRTLVDGVGYDVLFKRPISVEITGTGNSSNGYVIINGTTYSGAASGLEVNSGDLLVFHVYGQGGQVTIDSIVVAGPIQRNNTSVDYEWIVPDGVSAIVIKLYARAGFGGYTTITVTTS